MPLPQPAIDTAPEPFATPIDESVCDPRDDRPGVTAFRDFVLRYQGGGKGHISRPCGATGPKSGHYAGRAWDWMIDATDPDQKARADELIAWLLDDEAELFRRAGLRYLIWNERIFSSWRAEQSLAKNGDISGGWKPRDYGDPHTSHVHFSFSKEGADGLTSFYDWLRAGGPGAMPQKPPGEVPNPFRRARGGRYGYALVGGVLGFAGVWAARRLRAARVR